MKPKTADFKIKRVQVGSPQMKKMNKSTLYEA